MRVRCPDVERAPPQFLVLGAGEVKANGAYDLKVRRMTLVVDAGYEQAC